MTHKRGSPVRAAERTHAVRQVDLRRPVPAIDAVVQRETPQRPFLVGGGEKQTMAGRVNGERCIPIGAGQQPARYPRSNIEAVQPRSVAIGIAGQVEERPTVDDRRVADMAIGIVIRSTPLPVAVMRQMSILSGRTPCTK